MTDFIIVGRGLAATTLMHMFHSHGISFKTIGRTDLSYCSRVAAGIWNPIVFKRLTKSWKADRVIPALNLFYKECERLLNTQFIQHRTILRPFKEEQEKNLWEKKSKNELDEYLDSEMVGPGSAPWNKHTALGFGKVKQAGNIDLPLFIDATSRFFKKDIMDEEFTYGNLKISDEGVDYQGTKSRSIVFCEGYLVKNNPYFSWVPLKPAKGEVLTVQINNLEVGRAILNQSVFVMPLAGDEYKVGATYEWKELNEEPSEKGRRELETKLQQIVGLSYRIVNQQAGIRPASADRRPIIGPHPIHRQLYIFNGLGTKGVMLAPYFATNFVNFYLKKEALEPEVDISRFSHLYKKE